MSSVIKSSYLRNLQTSEFLIDSARADPAAATSPEDTAALIVAQANDDAAAIISTAQDEAETIREQARQEGCEAALVEIETERAALAERIVEVESDAARQIEEFWADVEPQILKLAVTIASKIVRHEIAEDKEHIIATVKTGLRHLRDRHEIKIRVGPADYEFMREHKQEIAASCDGIRSLEIIDDRRVDEGGCIIESNNGHLDGRVKTQLKEAERALLEAANHGNSDTTTES